MTIEAMNLLPVLAGGREATLAFHCDLLGRRNEPRPQFDFSASEVATAGT